MMRSKKEIKYRSDMDWEVPYAASKQKLQQRDYQGALVDLDYANEKSPTNALIFKRRGDVKRLLNDYHGAIADLTIALDFMEMKSSSTFRYRGEAKKMIGDYKGALEDMDRAWQLKKTYKTLQSRADVKKLLDDLQGALTDLNWADKLHPDDPFTLTIRGEVKMLLGDPDAALEDLDRALRLTPDDSFALCIRAELNQCMRRYEEALVDLDRAFTVDPNNHLVISLRNEVRAVLHSGLVMVSAPLSDSNKIRSGSVDEAQSNTNVSTIFVADPVNNMDLSNVLAMVNMDQDDPMHDTTEERPLGDIQRTTANSANNNMNRVPNNNDDLSQMEIAETKLNS